jgi:hypothetical protein
MFGTCFVSSAIEAFFGTCFGTSLGSYGRYVLQLGEPDKQIHVVTVNLLTKVVRDSTAAIFTLSYNPTDGLIYGGRPSPSLRLTCPFSGPPLIRTFLRWLAPSSVGLRLSTMIRTVPH